MTGTDCRMNAVATDRLIINTTTGATEVIPPVSVSVQVDGFPIGTEPGSSISFVFDTTYFGSGATNATLQPITIDVEVTYADNVETYKHFKAFVYNQAYVLGNNTNRWGNDAKVYNSETLMLMNHSVESSLDDPKQAILTFLPAATVFYIGTHGSPGQFGDCFYEPPVQGQAETGQVILASDVSTALSQKNALQTPPYNFVFIDGCMTSGDETLPEAFNVSGWQDAAYMGFLNKTPNSSAWYRWSQSFFGYLEKGETVRNADRDTYNYFQRIKGPDAKVLAVGLPFVQGDYNTTLFGTLYGYPHGSPWYAVTGP